MADLIITPSTGKIEFIYQGGPDGQQGQTSRVESIIVDPTDGVVFSGRISASSVTAPLNVINVTAGSSNVNYPFIFASSGETGAKSLLMDSAGGTYNPSINTATIDVSGNSATTTLASNSTQLNGQAASYYTDIVSRLGYTPVNQAGGTVTGNLTVNGNFAVNGSFTAFSASNVYISSSQLYIEDNILTLNAFSPYLRYAGVEMYDSGSGTLSSLLWDGEADYFFLTGSSVNGKIITGPDGQTNLTANYIPKATAGYKLGNSLIYDNGTNVGIGTTSPSSPLTVQSNGTQLRLQTTNEPAAYFANIGARYDSSHPFTIEVSNGAATATEYFGIYADAGGANNRIALLNSNVGIGTSSPAVMLHVQKSQNSETTVIINNTNSGAAAAARLDLQSHANNYLTLQAYGQNFSGNVCGIAGAKLNTILDNALTANSTGLLIGTVSTNPMYFVTANSVKMLLSASGNLGIGTTSPAYKLDVNGTIALSGFPFAYKSGNYNILVEPAGTNALYLGNATDPTNYYDNTTHYIRNRGGGSTYVTINSSGNVGIGTSSPGGKFEIRTDASSNYIFSGSSTSGYTTTFTMDDTASYFGHDSSVRSLILRTNSTARLTVKGDGNVGIGTTNPVSKLEVSGSVTATSFTGSLSGSITSALTASYLTPANSYTVTNLNASNISASLTGSFGMIGIGTSSPSYKLDIAGGIKIGGEETLPFAIGSMYLSYNSAINRIYYGDGTGYDLRFSKRGAGATTDFVTFKDTGNIGIGTTSPVARLTVTPSGSAFDSSNTMVAYFGKTTANGYGSTFIRVARSDSTTTTGSNAEYTDIEHNSGGATPFRYGTYCDTNIINGWAATNGVYGSINFVTSGSTRMTIAGGTSAGNVGIGTTNPSSRVHIYENANRVTYIAQNNNHIARFEAYGTATAIDTTASNGIFFRISGGDIVKFAADGNVGIGTSSPGYKLHVTGDIYANGGWLRVSGTSGLYFETYGGGWFMDDATWVRTYSAKSVWTSTGLLGSNGGLTVGYGGTSPTSLGAIIAGSVGIGTNSPATKLEVYGVVRVSESPSGGILQLTAGASAIDIASTFYGGSRRPITFTMDSEKVRIAADGNVGIGTTSPANKLHVEGGNSVPLYVKGGTSAWVIFERNTKQLYLNANYSDTNLYAQISPRSSDSMSLSLSSREVAGDLLVSTSGNVGIGTTSPNTLLNIHGATPFVRINTTATADHGIKISYGNSDTHGLHLLYNANSAVSYIDNTYPVNAGFVYGDIYFRQNVAGTMTTRMTIKADGGNVGIGTTGPSARLHVFDSNESPATGNLLVTSTGGNASIRIDSQNTSKYTYFTLSQGGVGKFELGITPTSSDLYINHNVQSGANGAAIYIKKADGNVGIGTTSPASRLHVVGSEAYIRVTDSDDSGVFFIGNASGFGYIRAFSRDFRFLNAAGASLINIASGGNIGIGTTAPNDKLDVVGRVYAYRYIAVSSNASLPAYATDTNTGMFNAATNQIGFSISSAEKVRIDTNGNVGIGTTVPGKKLDVEGVVRTRGATGTGGFEIGAATTGTAKWRIEWDSASDSLDFNWVG